ncbi:response regulator transcription factor [Thalassotalea atypica]|uniref:response regulator transcription factor n=1 Tax=Thalassotalea atypica TaxID=2054316 RepID=UPI002573F039|nr:response regulator transcription factor [Thalassotalea atypica]
MRILIVEDDLQLQENVRASLTEHQYVVDVAADGEEGLFQASEYPYDAAIIDVGLPKIDGIRLIEKLRANDISFPIIILTARDHWQDKVQGLNAGADDYLTKPFQTPELLARLNALIRRSAGKATPIIVNGPLAINTQSQLLTLDERDISLSAMEYRLIEFLMLHPNQVHSKTTLTEHLYDQDFDLDSNVIEVFIRRLRKKIDPQNSLLFIDTIRGQGYRLKSLLKE